MPSINEVREQMNQRYAAGTAYKSELPFDRQRGERIRETTLDLARSATEKVLGFFETRTLDVGSGEGGIASFWPHKNIVGIEISEEAVKRAKKSYPDVDYRRCAVEEFKLSLNGENGHADAFPFHLVVAQESIEHWTDASAGLRAIREAMASPSVLVITTPNRDSLHCRMSRKLGLGEPPYCSTDHIHEFGFEELVSFVRGAGFTLIESRGVGLLPYWAMERVFGVGVRNLTDHDEEINEWMNDIARHAPAEYAFIQCHAFRRSS